MIIYSEEEDELFLTLKASKEYQKCLDELRLAYKGWRKNRIVTVKSLKAIVHDMDKDEFRNNVTSIIGSIGGIGSNVAVLFELAVESITGGVGLAVAGLIGGIINYSSEAYAKNFAVAKCQEADNEIKADQTKSEKLQEAETNLINAIVTLKEKLNVTHKHAFIKLIHLVFITESGWRVWEKVKSIPFKTERNSAHALELTEIGWNGAEDVVKATKASNFRAIVKCEGTVQEAKEIDKLAEAGSKIGKFSKGFAVAGLAFDLWTFGSAGIDIFENGSKSVLGIRITEHISELEKSLIEAETHFFNAYAISS